jgi:diguanylate cyclase (GGDEF)-like protein/PAS domain S-box-containing protein
MNLGSNTPQVLDTKRDSLKRKKTSQAEVTWRMSMPLVIYPLGGLVEVSNLNPYINLGEVTQLILTAMGWLIGGTLLLIGLGYWLRLLIRLKKAKQVHKKATEELEKLFEKRTTELESTNRQLQQEIVARMRSQEALQESKERFRTQYKEIPIPTYTWQLLGEEFVLVDYNDAAEVFSQVQLGEYLGKTAAQMFWNEPEIIEEIYRCYVEKTSIKREMFHRMKSTGEDKHLAASYTFVHPNLVIVHLEDITEGYRTEAELQIRIRQQSVVAKVGQRGLAGIDLSTLMDEAVTLVAQTLEVEYCKILEVLPNDSAFFLRAGVGWQEGLVGSATVGMQASSQANYTLLRDQPVIVEDLRVETRFGGEPLLHNHKVISGVSVIIPGREHPFGVLSAHTTRKRRFTEDDAHFLEAIANVLATAIERKLAEERLYLLERAVNASSNGIVITDALESDHPVIYTNPSFERHTGYTFNEVVGCNCRFLQGSDTDQPALDELRTALEQGRECQAVLRNYRKDGTLFWNELHIAPVRNPEGYLTNFIGVQVDITERKLAEEALRDSEERFRAIAEAIPIPLIMSRLSDGIILYANPHVGPAFGLPYNQLLGGQVSDLYYNPADRQVLLETLAQEEYLHAYEVRLKKADGRPFWVAISLRLLKFNGEPAILSTFYDLSERKRMEEQLMHDALYDALTGLPNRVLFMARLDQALRQAKQQNDYLFAILFLDLDRFKVVNDSLGHMVGDQLLIAIARKLERCLRSTDTVARLGGDEFTILLDAIENVEDAITIAEQIHSELRQPFHLNGHEVFTTASIGIATGNLGYDRPEDLVRDADIAMYRAKERGPAHHDVFDQEMYARAKVRLQLETDLRQALRNREFQVHYQPITSLISGTITGFEALVRWHHPKLGLVSPAEFIPIAEDTGLIIPLGAWILREACAKMQAWQTHLSTKGRLTISVNLSGKQLAEPDLIEQIDQIMGETGLDSGSLKLEITESVLMDNATSATKMLWQLRARNIQLCLDDFGTGYSSLSYLHRFPVNTLKIDRSFVSRMSRNDENLEIVRVIVTLAHTLKMDVIAEGVETREQLTQLKLLGCEQGQGYFFSKPLDSKAAEALIAQAPQW